MHIEIYLSMEGTSSLCSSFLCIYVQYPKQTIVKAHMHTHK